MGIFNEHPERLTNQQYMSRTSLQIFEQQLTSPIKLHWHEFYEVSIVRVGKGEHLLNGVPYYLEPGSIFLLTPADFHQLEPAANSPLELYDLIFSDEMLNEELYQLLFEGGQKNVTVIAEANFSRVLASCERILWELEHSRPGHQLLIKSELTSILVEIVRGRATNQILPFRDDQPPYIRKTLIYLQQHFRENISLQEIARQVQLNPTYFSEYFSRATGSTFQSYLQTLRLNFAASLLRMSQLSVTEICYAAGFNTLSHFERVFKQKYNHSPKTYRKLPVAED